MKKILFVEDDYATQNMYKRIFHDLFPEVHISQCYSMSDVEKILSEETFDLYILDGQIIGGHTTSIITSLPKEKVVVISADGDYKKDVESMGIPFIWKPFLGSQIREKKEFWASFLYK